jgi:glycosyltransferase involved in cell wall biosynthesis
VRVAIIHDWLYTVGGAERVLAAMLRCFPNADLHCLFDLLPQEERRKLGYETSKTSFLQHMPGIGSKHRLYLPLMPIAIEQFDLSSYDVIISSSSAVAKGVLTGPDQLHLTYVHSPMRYAWDLQHQYLRESGVARGLKGILARTLLHHMRVWDTRTGNGPDAYMTNSHFVARRIRKIYGREARVIAPPVSVPAQCPQVAKQRYFFTASRLVPYKNVHMIVEAFRSLPDEKLIVAGEGPELGRLRALAGANVEFVGYRKDAELRRLMGSARAFVFAAEEDFGIVPVEAQGEGTPVLALGRGGARETIVTTGPARTGLFFDSPEPEAIAATVRRFIATEQTFRPEACHRNAQRFETRRFDESFSAFVRQQQGEFGRNLDRARAQPLPAEDAVRSAPSAAVAL